MKKSIIAVLLLFITAIASAQQHVLSDWQNITSKNFVSRIIHDQNYLYVGTMGGGLIKINKQTGEQTLLCRANGDITDNSIIDMALHDGELWVGTEHYGLAKITDEGVEKFGVRNAGFAIQQYIAGIYFDSDGGMLVGGLTSLYRFDGQQCTGSYEINIISPFTYVTSIKADASGRVWVSCYDALGRATLCVFTQEGLVPISHPYGIISRIEIDDKGYVWLASEAGLVKFDGTNFTPYTPDNSNLPEYALNDIKADEQGNLWMVSPHYLTKFDGEQFTSYPYTSNHVDDNLICVDADGNDVYVGSHFKGLLHLTDNGLAVVPLIENRLDNNTFSFISGCLDNNGLFYVGTLYGLQTYNKETEEANLMPMSQTYQVEPDVNGNIWLRWPWFSPDTCLMEITPTATTVYWKDDYPFNDCTINQIKFDRYNRLWLATTKGIYRRDGQTWTAYNKENSGLSYNYVNSLSFDANDHVWCATNGGGLFLFDGSNWTNYTTKNSQLPSDFVGAITVDNNNIVWMNCRIPRYPDTYGLEFGFGLTRFDGVHWKTYNRNNSPIPSDCLWDIQVDADNNKWLATAGDVGLVCYDENDWSIYDVDNSSIALNEVTKITIDNQRDLIWLTHYPGGGISTARMNCQAAGIQSSATANDNKPSTIYDLTGRKISMPTKGIYIKEGRKYIK